MINPEDLNSRKSRITEENKIQDTRKNNSADINYTTGFLKEQIGKLMRIEFLIGNNMVDKIGFLEEVGADYILLRAFEGDSIIYADMNTIKFITISAGFPGMAGFSGFGNFSNMNANSSSNTNRYY